VARLLASLRLLVVLTRRDLSGLSSLALNNLFFCALFLLQGSHSAHTAFYSSLPFLIILFVPLLFAICADTLTRLPRTRTSLWPLTHTDAIFLRIASLALSPAFWLLGGILTLWMGLAAGLAYLLVALLIQTLVALTAYLTHSRPALSPLRLIPAPPGSLGRLIQLSLRQLFISLDLYAAILLSIIGTIYRFLTHSPDREAFPILAILIALTLSTYAQRLFGLDTPGSLTRYRLLPIALWRILLAKDIAYLIIIVILTAPLGLTPALSFSLIALAIGRYSSLRQRAPQSPWRFTSGDPRFGALQIFLGTPMAIATARTSLWFLAASFAIYAISLPIASRWGKPRP
jgi:hypothetical protein